MLSHQLGQNLVLRLDFLIPSGKAVFLSELFGIAA
jgi:hypothetical protein